MAKNVCSPLQKSFEWCEGRPEVPGMRRRLYFTSKQNISKYATLPKDELGRPTSSKLQGDFVLNADKYFNYCDIDARTSNYTSEPQGELPSQTQINKLMCEIPSVAEDATEMAASFNNTDNLYIFQDMLGNYRVIGNEMYPTKSTFNQDGGAGPTGQSKSTLNVEATDIMPAPYYYGAIPTEDGIINEATGD